MEHTWILLADRGGARVLQVAPDKALLSIHEIVHSEGRLQNREIDTDKPGRAFDSMGHNRHATGSEVEPTQQVALRWAKELATLLEKEHNAHRYSKLMLVAEPGFMGLLKEKLGTQVQKAVVATINKDLRHTPQTELPRHLGL